MCGTLSPSSGHLKSTQPSSPHGVAGGLHRKSTPSNPGVPKNPKIGRLRNPGHTEGLEIRGILELHHHRTGGISGQVAQEIPADTIEMEEDREARTACQHYAWQCTR